MASQQSPLLLNAHAAIVAGANHGIGTAAARSLADCGAAVPSSYLRLAEERDPGVPESYLRSRESGAEFVPSATRASGERAKAIEADLSEHDTPKRLLDIAETRDGFS